MGGERGISSKASQVCILKPFSLSLLSSQAFWEVAMASIYLHFTESWLQQMTCPKLLTPSPWSLFCPLLNPQDPLCPALLFSCLRITCVYSITCVHTIASQGGLPTSDPSLRSAATHRPAVSSSEAQALAQTIIHPRLTAALGLRGNTQPGGEKRKFGAPVPRSSGKWLKDFSPRRTTGFYWPHRMS